MNIEQHAVFQARIVETQRLALDLMEAGHAKIGIALGAVAFKALRIKPTVDAAPVAAKPVRKSKPVKSEGEGV
ncbi:hypothetical protein STPYR_10916 [uncultured Stenotrophomonas sp.]|uniref:Uncharacterized protein n=1 Tax=uncultured Stenotrophomonas sp. TaxID=165438 RepID=A0A1Y5Q521_9GAMM|nr:hypothetical protein STPYR_10916 [uncultured Stenotrophomonas sp.]